MKHGKFAVTDIFDYNKYTHDPARRRPSSGRRRRKATRTYAEPEVRTCCKTVCANR
jgi:hypothetical protein